MSVIDNQITDVMAFAATHGDIFGYLTGEKESLSVLKLDEEREGAFNAARDHVLNQRENILRACQSALKVELRDGWNPPRSKFSNSRTTGGLTQPLCEEVFLDFFLDLRVSLGEPSAKAQVAPTTSDAQARRVQLIVALCGKNKRGYDELLLFLKEQQPDRMWDKLRITEYWNHTRIAWRACDIVEGAKHADLAKEAVKDLRPLFNAIKLKFDTPKS